MFVSTKNELKARYWRVGRDGSLYLVSTKNELKVQMVGIALLVAVAVYQQRMN